MKIFLVCVLRMVVTFTCPDLNMFLITAYGRSPGALLRVMRLFRIFSLMLSGLPRVARFIVALWPLQVAPKYPRSRYTIYPGWERSI